MGTLAGSGLVYGVARNVQLRTEVLGDDSGTSSTVVCNFRVEVHDRQGRPLRLVPVEMRGYSFEGAVNEGDRIRAHGQVKRGTLRVKRLQNLTTGAEVSARTTPVVMIVVAVVLVVAWAVFLFGFVVR
ncbi:hypothetical protein [Streptomyces sp. NPDC047974]|uniref:hypothetical protein n=1 Tax=Streptomyces sp. NPDC047974 TaxID=3154343 RepID=UPI0033CD54AA